MKPYSCVLAAGLLLLASPPAALNAQCDTCGPVGPRGAGYGPPGPVNPLAGVGHAPPIGYQRTNTPISNAPDYYVPGDWGGAAYPPHSLQTCDPSRGPCGLYTSEQEKLDYDWCQCCIVNLGHDFTIHNAQTPRFGPTWRFAADALFLIRDGDRDRGFASLGPVTAGGRNVVLSDESFPLCLEAGGKATVSRALGHHDNLLIEGVYFGMHQWNEEDSYRDATANTAGGTGILTSPFTGLGNPTQIVGLDFNTLSTIAYTSEIENYEINLRHRVGMLCGPIETTLLYGVRYMRIDESFTYLGVSNTPAPLGSSNRTATFTENDLIGFQVGALGAYRVNDRFWIEMDVKATLAQNDSSQQTTYTNVNNGVTTTFNGEAGCACTAFIGDINLITNYQITTHLAVRAGYQAVWADGVAVALENFNSSLAVLTQGPAEVNDNGTLVFHGPHLGAVLTW